MSAQKIKKPVATLNKNNSSFSLNSEADSLASSQKFEDSDL